MGRIEADIALKSWLFGFRPCSGQGAVDVECCLHETTHMSRMTVI